VRRIRAEIDRIRRTPEAHTVERLSLELAARIQEIATRAPDEQDPAVRFLRDCCALLETEDKRFLQEMKATLRAGTQVFETYQRDTIRQGSTQLLETVQGIPRLSRSKFYTPRGTTSAWIKETTP